MATIHEAARTGDAVALLSFLTADAFAIDARDRHSRTPLHLASWAGHADVVHILCGNNADVGAAAIDNMAAIHFASQKGHIQVVRFLLAAGASVNVPTRKGMTPLHYAIQGGHLELAKLLIKHGACLDNANKAGKKAIDFAKDDEIRGELEAAQASSIAAKPRKEKKTAKNETASDDNIEHKSDEPLPDAASSQGNVSPPKKKSKVKLLHLGVDHESEESY